MCFNREQYTQRKENGNCRKRTKHYVRKILIGKENNLKSCTNADAYKFVLNSFL